MILIIGGAYQGKTEYAKKTYGLQDADIFTCENTDIDPNARAIPASGALCAGLRAHGKGTG